MADAKKADVLADMDGSRTAITIATVEETEAVARQIIKEHAKVLEILADA